MAKYIDILPDKIYVYAAHPAPFWFSDKQIPNMIEYIRKDALLEWLEDMRFMANSKRVGAYQNVIDKLNKM